jgi:hypothetical protein
MLRQPASSLITFWKPWSMETMLEPAPAAHLGGGAQTQQQGAPVQGPDDSAIARAMHPFYSALPFGKERFFDVRALPCFNLVGRWMIFLVKVLAAFSDKHIRVGLRVSENASRPREHRGQ